MSRNSALVLVLALGSLILPAQAFAQLTPPAGSAGAGNSAISGVPFGPANPRVLSDPSGIGNAATCPAAPRQPPGANDVLRIDQSVTAVAHSRRRAALRGRITADHQRA